MSHKTGTQRRTWKERALALLLAAVMVAGLVPGLTVPASAEHWADTYLDQLVDWGVLRADQTADPDAALTRADFMAIINRAYGYTETGPIPFEDVKTTDWFYDDVAIAYTAGYMAGTSDVTASPHDTLTREQAVCILGRNMMMKDTPGESLAFSDSRDVSDWARGTVKTAVDNYIISGYPDNTFHPKAAISKAQMAVLITQCVGNPIQQSGTYEMGGVFGNVTITAPNVTLRNTTISGDLFVSGGVGLGGIKLENVNVLGRIIVSGTGESEGGDASVVMRNVTAEEMVVDNMRNKTVTIRADGITEINKTTVRTNAYIEDNNTDDKGLMNIELDGESGTHLTLAGRIKNVVDKTPNSLLQVAKGTVAKLTVDEAAVNSTVQLDRNTEVGELNLDVATNVTGDGDIDQLNVNAPGSVVSMLPDKIYIRPGLTANIAGVIMDHVAAEEGSLDPRLLSGYPAAKDITPTGLRADFAGNKKGTVYWAVSSITDGSISEDDLISPPSYGSKAIRNGSVAAPAGGGEVSAQITGLTVGGAYYLTAILVDDQGNRSPVKSVSFSTPDNTVPAFGTGYPYMSFIGKASEHETLVTAQVAVMATKSCKMYYAVLPAGAAAPTIDELKSAAVSSNLGYGVVDLEKNEVRDGDLAVIVSRRLEEQKNYVLYMWLTDGVNGSAVTSLAFSTPDVTPPEFVVHPHMNGDAQATTVPMAATLSENGTIFWAVVESGTPYPKPNNQRPADNDPANDNKTALLTSEFAKLQVANGMNAVSSGRVNATANTEVPMNITGLEAEKSYDLYYLAQDTAGNYTVQVYKLQGGIRTLDTNSPTVRQIFSKYDGTDSARNPMRDTNIILEFSENVCFSSGKAGGRDLLSLYEDTQTGTAAEKAEALELFVEALRSSIDFKVSVFGIPQSAVKGNPGVADEDWALDFEKATVANVNGKVQLTFPYDDGRGLRLASGGIYHFEIDNLEDIGGHKMESNNGTKVDYTTDARYGHNVPQFTVVFARVTLTDQFRLPDNEVPKAIRDSNNGNMGSYQVDFKFRMMPTATDSVSDDISYNLMLWTDTAMDYDLYYRAVTKSGKVLTIQTDENGEFIYGMPNMRNKVYDIDDSGWIRLNNSNEHFFKSELAGKSLHSRFNSCTGDTFPKLNKLYSVTQDDAKEEIYYDFVISIHNMKGMPNPDTWSGRVNFYVDVAAGISSILAGLGTDPTEQAWADFVANGLNSPNGGETIGNPSTPAANDPRRLHMVRDYTDSLQPAFADGFPYFGTNEDGTVTMNLALDRPGTIYYVIGEADISGMELPNAIWQPGITTTTIQGQLIDPDQVPRNGTERDRNSPPMPELLAPKKTEIQQPGSWSEGSKVIDSNNVYCTNVSPRTHDTPKLEPNRTYYVYFVIAGSGAEPSEVEIYKFKTDPVSRPKIQMTPGSDGVNTSITNMPSVLYYMIYPESDLQQIYWMKPKGEGGTPSNMLRDILSETAAQNGGLPAYYSDYTILQALTTSYSWSAASNNGAASGYFPTDGSDDPKTAFNDYSVFDIYASAEVKQAIANWIRSGFLSADIQYETLTTPSGPKAPVGFYGGEHRVATNQVINASNEVYSGGTYYVIAVARSQQANVNDSAELIYSFKAARYQITSGAPPELVSASGSAQVSATTGNLCGGTIYLTFDKQLHTAANVPLDTGAAGGSQFFGGSLPDGVASAVVSHNGDSTSVTITLTDARNGGTRVQTPFTATVAYGSLMNSGGTPALKTLKMVIEQEVIRIPATNDVIKGDYYLRFYWGVGDVPFGTATRVPQV